MDFVPGGSHCIIVAVIHPVVVVGPADVADIANAAGVSMASVTADTGTAVSDDTVVPGFDYSYYYNYHYRHRGHNDGSAIVGHPIVG